MSVTKIIRLEEVKKNNGSNSTWVVIHDSVYDLTDYLNEHPGGPDVLLEEAGKEATEAFEDVGHSSDARDVMAKYKIGELHEDDVVKKSKQDSSQTGKRNMIWNKRNGLVAVIVGIAVAFVSVYRVRAR